MQKTREPGTKIIQDKKPKKQIKPARQSSNKTKQQDKVQIKNQSSTQTWKIQNQNIPNRGQEHGQTKTHQDNDWTRSEGNTQTNYTNTNDKKRNR